MKRLVSAFLAGAMALSLAACGGAASTSTVASSASASGRAAASETAASDLDYIKEKGKMVIGYTVYEPMIRAGRQFCPRRAAGSRTHPFFAGFCAMATYGLHSVMQRGCHAVYFTIV